MIRKYYPNNWRAIRDTPDNVFPSLSYEELKDWKVHGYMIPDSIDCMLRITDPKTGKVTEKIYSTTHNARKCINKCFAEKKEFVLCTMEGMYHLKPGNYPLEFNNDD